MMIIRGGSRTVATSKMELFVIIVNGFQPLTIITKSAILDVATVLDLPLIMMIMMLMNCFCAMVDRRKAFSLISSREHCQRSSPSRIYDTLRAGFEPAQNLSSGLVESSCAVIITTVTTNPLVFWRFHWVFLMILGGLEVILEWY